MLPPSQIALFHGHGHHCDENNRERGPKDRLVVEGGSGGSTAANNVPTRITMVMMHLLLCCISCSKLLWVAFLLWFWANVVLSGKSENLKKKKVALLGLCILGRTIRAPGDANNYSTNYSCIKDSTKAGHKYVAWGSAQKDKIWPFNIVIQPPVWSPFAQGHMSRNLSPQAHLK